MDRAALRAVALRVAALALLLLLALVAVLSVRTLGRLPDATIYLIRSEPTSFTLEPVRRQLGNRDPDDFARLAVAALADGATPGEAAAGLASAVPEATEVLSARPPTACCTSTSRPGSPRAAGQRRCAAGWSRCAGP